MKKIIGVGLAVLGLSSISSAQSGQIVFDESFVHEIRITFDDAHFWDSLTTYYDDFTWNGADKKYLMASEVSIDGQVIDSVGVRQKGFFSNWGADMSVKKPLKLDFKEFKDQKFNGLKKINLANGFKDPSMMRDALSYHIFREVGLKVPRTAYTKVYLNNEYWGLYIMVEQIDSEFLEDHYANPDGNLYKCINNTSLNYQGTNWDQYTEEFALKTNKTLNDNTRFVEFVEKINTTSDANFKNELDGIFETSDYLAILACDILMKNWDSYYDHGRNFYVYLNPDDNKFEWIPWDYNLSFSSFNTDIIVNYNDPGYEKPLVKRMQENAEYRTMYFARMCHIILNRFNLNYLEEYIDNTAQLIRPALDEDPNKFFTIENFDTGVVSEVQVFDPVDPTEPEEIFPGLKDFISARTTAAMNELSSYGFNCVLSVNGNDDQLEWNVYPNPIYDGILMIDVPTNAVETTVSIRNVAGQEVYSATMTGAKHAIDVESYQNGMYFVTIQQDDKITTKKVVKR